MLLDRYRFRAQVLAHDYADRLSLTARVRLAHIALDPKEEDGEFLETLDYLFDDPEEGQTREA